MRAYYREDDYPFDEALAARAIRELLANEQLGWLWVIESNHEIVGYLAVTLGFSLEYRGRDAFIDELYLRPEARASGLGPPRSSSPARRAVRPKCACLPKKSNATSGARSTSIAVRASRITIAT